MVLPFSQIAGLKFFKIKSWERNWKREKNKKSKTKRERKKKARPDKIIFLLFIIPSTFVFRLASLCAFPFSTVLLSLL